MTPRIGSTSRLLLPLFCLCTIGFMTVAEDDTRETLPNTKPLTLQGDLAAQMVAGIGKYLDHELAASVEKRKQFWQPDYSSHEAYVKSVEPSRERLKKILGVVDERVKPAMEYVVTDAKGPGAIAKGDGFSVYAVRWPVLEGVVAEGLLLQPDEQPRGRFVAIPDADWTPEMLVGLVKGAPEQLQRNPNIHRWQVLIPTLIDRRDTWSGNSSIKRWTNQPHREFVYRMSYELGRHVIGYEVQKVLAGVDWFESQDNGEKRPVVVFGYGEGGLVGLRSAAIDTRIDGAFIHGYFGDREALWGEPIYRNVWGLLLGHSDVEIAALVAPRPLHYVGSWAPRIPGPPKSRPGRSGAAPGVLEFPRSDKAHERVAHIYEMLGLPNKRSLGQSMHGFTGKLLPLLASSDDQLPPGSTSFIRKPIDSDARQKRQFNQFVQYTQRLMRESESRRQEFFWDKINVEKLNRLTPPAQRLAAYKKSCEPFREYFHEEVIGKLPAPTMPMNPRTRLKYNEPKWKGYEVVIDVYPDVFSYGVLLVPKGLKPGEKRPVVVCQHGLEGRPDQVVDPKIESVYHSFGAQLADRGYLVFAPQNPYIGGDNFRVLQRKANPLKLSLFSFIVRQHERILDWLCTLPAVDSDRIGFYGLSYGGKTAMRVPAILDRYCLSICSADFNEWIRKNCSYDLPYSYMFTGEYEMPEFNLGNTFNYAELAALIAPRPFMVERGHDDGVGEDHWVAYEYAKVRRLYAKLGIPHRTEIEFFDGGHQINGKGTFEFLDRHLRSD